MKMIIQANQQKNGFNAGTDFKKARLHDWLNKYAFFEIKPIVKESGRNRRYLEGAVIPHYAEWQYHINPKDPELAEARRYVFKRDFMYTIVHDRDGMPARVPVSSKGKAYQATQNFVEWAEQNGCPVPNPDLYKLYRDKWSMDLRFGSYHEWLDFLGLAVDAMPSAQTLAKLDETNQIIAD